MYNTKDEFPPKTSAKKDKRKWCRGIEGREHKKVLRLGPSKYHGWKRSWDLNPINISVTIECKVCGKQFDWMKLGEAFYLALEDQGQATFPSDVTVSTEGMYGYCTKNLDLSRSRRKR